MRDDDIDDTVISPRAPAPRHAAPGSVGSSGATDDADDTDDTVIRPRRHVRSVDDAGAIDAGDGFGDAEDTVITPRPSPTDRPGDLLGDTVVRGPSRPPAQGESDRVDEPRLQSDPVVPAPRVPSIRVAGRTLRLDRPVIIGRRPSLPRVGGGPEPELVTVPSPHGEVSSSHVRVHASGEATVVEDLRSTNGTVVRPAGAAPFRMAAGGANVVLTGTVVEIGDGNVIEVLSPHLRVASTVGDLPPFPAWPSDPPTPGTPRTPRERS